MSKNRYMQALNCQWHEVVPHQLWLHHPDFIKDATGVDYYDRPKTASVRFHQRFDVDNGGPVDIDDTPKERPVVGENKEGGQTREEGFSTVWNEHNRKPFTEPEQLWDFDPFGDYAMKAVEPTYAVGNYKWCFQRETWQKRRQDWNDYWAKIEAVYPGKFTNAQGFYCTTFMWGVCIFGWEIFLTALALDPDKTGQTLVRISEATAKMYEYFATIDDIEFVSAHDDLCIGSGPVADPQWYRKYIYPQYEKIFAPIKEKGKKVILTSDGDITKLAPDLAGIYDGFIFESSTPFDFMLENFGSSKTLVGGINVRPLTFGNESDVQKEVEAALEKGKKYPGYIAACCDTIPGNVPIANVYAYFDAVEKYRYRK